MLLCAAGRVSKLRGSFLGRLKRWNGVQFSIAFVAIVLVLLGFLYIKLHIIGWIYVPTFVSSDPFSEIRMGRIETNEVYFHDAFEKDYRLKRSSYELRIRNVSFDLPRIHFYVFGTEGNALSIANHMISGAIEMVDSEERCAWFYPETIEMAGELVTVFEARRCRALDKSAEITLKFEIVDSKGDVLGEESLTVTFERNGFYAYLDAL